MSESDKVAFSSGDSCRALVNAIIMRLNDKVSESSRRVQ